jgi:hypothetical protein
MRFASAQSRYLAGPRVAGLDAVAKPIRAGAGARLVAERFGQPRSVSALGIGAGLAAADDLLGQVLGEVADAAAGRPSMRRARPGRRTWDRTDGPAIINWPELAICGAFLGVGAAMAWTLVRRGAKARQVSRCWRPAPGNEQDRRAISPGESRCRRPGGTSGCPGEISRLIVRVRFSSPAPPAIWHDSGSLSIHAARLSR